MGGGGGAQGPPSLRASLFLEVRGISDMADLEAESVWVQNLPRAMKNVAVVLESLVRAIE